MRFSDRVHVCQYACVCGKVLCRRRIHPTGKVVSGGVYRQGMTTSPNSPDKTWVLKATIWAARAGDLQWTEQLNRLRPVASYDDNTKTWHLHLGALDLAGLNVLQALFDAASAHGTEVHLEPVAVPSHWDGPAFTGDHDVAALLKAPADTHRPLGQLPRP